MFYMRLLHPAIIRGLALVLCLTSPMGSTAAGPTTDSPIELPELGDGSSSLVSPQIEREIGEMFLKQVRASLPTVNDPVLKYYVERHVTNLAPHSELKEKVLSTVLIDSEDVNAFAAPGGVVGINLGLFLHAEDVHEYSSVVAHELAHLSQRHFARGIEQQRSQTLPTIAGLIAAIMIGAAGGGDAGLAAISTAQAAAQARALRYSRTRETEADRIGLNTMVQAGLDPNGMSRMFERMQRAYRYTRKPPEFLLTHPLSETRIADARTQAQQRPARAYALSTDYQMMRARAMVHYADSPQAAVKRFEKANRDDPDNPITEYGLALALSRAGEHTRAITLGDRLFASSPDKILHITSYADLLIAAGKLDQAMRLLSHQLVINPDNAPMAMLYSQALIKAEDYSQAQAVLKRQSIVRPNDAEVWYELAEVAGLAGDIVNVHLARAEFFTLHGGYQKAIQHLEYARRLIPGDNTQLVAKIDQRVRDLRDELRELRSS